MCLVLMPNECFPSHIFHKNIFAFSYCKLDFFWKWGFFMCGVVGGTLKYEEEGLDKRDDANEIESFLWENNRDLRREVGERETER